MQTTKELTRKRLLQTARCAFLKKGFKAVSMREISKKSGVGLSNIYNYYRNKESLLADVLRPVRDVMNKILEEHNCAENLSIDLFYSEEYQQDFIRQMLGIVSRFREELYLLFFASQDSRFQNYVEEWIVRSTHIGVEYVKQMKKRYPQLHTDISPFFIHFISSLSISVMKEVVQHPELSREETECFISEYVRFSTGGWGKLMQIGNVPITAKRAIR